MTDTRRIVLLGKTGSGKSSLANTIFGECMFSVNDSPNSETRECQSETRTVRGRSITIIDTPGLFDNNPLTTTRSQAVLQCMEACAPGPHAFLLMLKVERYTALEEAVVSIILQYFSEEALKYTTVVFTHGYDMREGMKIKDWMKQNEKLSELVQKCGNRCHVFDSTHWKNNQDQYRNNQNQVEWLLNTIDRMVQQNEGRYYTMTSMQIIRIHWWRLREAPNAVQIAVLLGASVGAGAVVALIASNIPWTLVMEKVAEAEQAMANGVEWTWKHREEIAEGVRFLATLYILYTQLENPSNNDGGFCTLL